MVYVLNTNLNPKKKIYSALTEIYGLGKHNSLQICDQIGISGETRLQQLSAIQLEHITQIITQNYNVGPEIRRAVTKNIQRYIRIACYRGFRHSQGLPVRGQRTHGNSRTVRKVQSLFLKKN